MGLTKSLSSLGLKLELVLVARAKTVHRANLHCLLLCIRRVDERLVDNDCE